MSESECSGCEAPRPKTIRDVYTQAIGEMDNALYALHSAVRTLGQIGLEDVGDRAMSGLSARQLLLRMIGTIDELEKCVCAECGEPITNHGESSACREWAKPARP